MFLKIGETLFSKYSQIQNKNAEPKNCFVGFDGFTDAIISVVDKSKGPDTQTFISTIKDFGNRLIEASEKSCNFELVTKETKLGGNAPIFTNALLEGGHRIVFTGAIGSLNAIEPLFQSMASRCSLTFPLAPSAKTDALEFQDGKIILGKLESLKKINYELILEQIGLHTLIEILDKTDLVVSANWTMLPFLTDIWRALLADITPKLTKRKRTLFVDLADPAKREDEDLKEALFVLSELNKNYDVILGLNFSEAEITSKLFGIKFLKETENQIKDSCFNLFKELKITRCLVHHTRFAISQDAEDQIYFPSLYTERPNLTTGAGDNFNAGYCNALLYGLNKEEMLLSALVTSGFYVREAHSPTMQNLKDFCENLIL